MASMEEEYERAVSFIENLPREGPCKPSKEYKLRFYALNQQATEGPCDKKKPTFLDTKGVAKWNAWMGLGKMSRETAMVTYVEEFRKFKVAYERAQLARY